MQPIDQVLEIYEYTVDFDDKVRFILAKDAHEAAEIAGHNVGGTQKLVNVRLSNAE